MYRLGRKMRAKRGQKQAKTTLFLLVLLKSEDFQGGFPPSYVWLPTDFLANW
jgi:hypothetical protein